LLIDGKRILLLGAEGCSELSEQPFIREATEEEKEAFYLKVQEYAEEHGPKSLRKDPKEANVDNTGRPYWVKVITDDAPEQLRKAAENVMRCVRLNVT